MSNSLNYFKSIVRVAKNVDSFNVDWTGKYRGCSSLVLEPDSTEQVSLILKHCFKHNLKVVPQGGNTGLVGGGVPVNDEIILSLRRLNSMRAEGDVACVGAGCILETVDKFMQKFGYFVPIDIGARGSCTIGGNVATNAGGSRVIRYGLMSNWVLGLEGVLSNGTVLTQLTTLRKNCGPSLNWLIGSEGTLGVITKVNLLCAPIQKSAVALLGVSSMEKMHSMFILAHKTQCLSAFEFWDKESTLLLQKIGLQSPFCDEFTILVEFSGNNVEEVLNDYCDLCMERFGLVGTVAQNLSQSSSFWNLRDSITPACASNAKGNVQFKYDLSLPQAKIYDIVQVVRNKVNALHCVGFGHFGDGNIHLNIGGTKDLASVLEPFVFEWVVASGGAISAEHGIGQQKRKYLHLVRSENVINVAKGIKDLMDPKGILNPYKVYP